MRKAAKSIAGCLYLESESPFFAVAGSINSLPPLCSRRIEEVIPVLYVVCRAIGFLVSKQQPKQKFW